MVDSFLQLPTEGTGPLTPAISLQVGANTVKIPLSVIAGQRTYVAGVVNSVVGASKNHLVLFNGVGSGVKVRIWDIKVNPNITAVVTGTSLVLYTARCSAVTGGSTTNVLRKTDTTDASLPAEIVGTTAPTSVTYNSFELGSCTVLVEETSGTEGRISLYKADSVLSALILNEGEGLGVQQGTFAGVGAINIFMYFTFD